MSFFRSYRFWRLMALCLAISSGITAGYLVKVRWDKYPLGPFWSLGNHRSIDHLSLAKYDTSLLAGRMLGWDQSMDKRALWHIREDEFFDNSLPRAYNLAIEINMLPAVEGKDYSSVIAWDEFEEEADPAKLAIYVYTDQRRSHGCPYVVWVKYSPALAYYYGNGGPMKGLSLSFVAFGDGQASEAIRSDRFRMREKLEVDWAYVAETFRSFLDAKHPYSLVDSLYSEEDLEKLRRACLLSLAKGFIHEKNNQTMEMVVHKNPSRFPIGGQTADDFLAEASDNINYTLYTREVVLFDWPGAYHELMPREFDWVVWWKNVHSLSTILIFGLSAFGNIWLACRKDPLALVKRLAQTIIGAFALVSWRPAIHLYQRFRLERMGCQKEQERRANLEHQAAERERRRLQKEAAEKAEWEEMRKRRQVREAEWAAMPKPVRVDDTPIPSRKVVAEPVFETSRQKTERFKQQIKDRYPNFDGYEALWPRLTTKNIEVLDQFTEASDGNEEVLAEMFRSLTEHRVPSHLLNSARLVAL